MFSACTLPSMAMSPPTSTPSAAPSSTRPSLPSLHTHLGDLLINPRKRATTDSYDTPLSASYSRSSKSPRLDYFSPRTPSSSSSSSSAAFAATPAWSPINGAAVRPVLPAISRFSLHRSGSASDSAALRLSPAELRRLTLPPLTPSSPFSLAASSPACWSPAASSSSSDPFATAYAPIGRSVPALSHSGSSAASSPELASRSLPASASPTVAAFKPLASPRIAHGPAPAHYAWQRSSSASSSSSPSGLGLSLSSATEAAAAATADRKRRGNLPKSSTGILNAWFCAHVAYPYPKEEEKHMLQSRTGLSMSQISNWFINARRRRRPGMMMLGAVA